jgi:hypothetical protein
MSNRLWIVLACAAVAALPARPAASDPPDAPAKVTCSFSNPGFSGWCRENVPIPKGKTGDQVCQSILSCLNDVQCTQPHCSNTSLRNGWRLEKVETGGNP